MKLILAVSLPLYALDQATKWWVMKSIELDFEKRVVVPDFFYLCYWVNTGSAFGLFKNGNPFFIVLSFVTLAALFVFNARGAFRDTLSRWGLALLVSGILGNLTDRLLHGHVVDFLLFYLHLPQANPWPAFNVADSCICISAGLFITATIREGKREAALET